MTIQKKVQWTMPSRFVGFAVASLWASFPVAVAISARPTFGDANFAKRCTSTLSRGGTDRTVRLAKTEGFHSSEPQHLTVRLDHENAGPSFGQRSAKAKLVMDHEIAFKSILDALPLGFGPSLKETGVPLDNVTRGSFVMRGRSGPDFYVDQ